MAWGAWTVSHQQALSDGQHLLKATAELTFAGTTPQTASLIDWGGNPEKGYVVAETASAVAQDVQIQVKPVSDDLNVGLFLSAVTATDAVGAATHQLSLPVPATDEYDHAGPIILPRRWQLVGLLGGAGAPVYTVSVFAQGFFLPPRQATIVKLGLDSQ